MNVKMSLLETILMYIIFAITVGAYIFIGFLFVMLILTF